MKGLYILTDALGFTTAVHATPIGISNELLRLKATGLQLQVPLKGVHWHADYFPRRGQATELRWQKCEEFVWP